MQYRKDMRSGNQLSVLGYGCMRFPRGIHTKIDYKKSEKLVLEAIEKGINYFDTAYIYFGSEEILGKILHNNNVRERVYIATKLPIMKCNTYEDFDRLFQEQLEHLKTDYIDYYLMHNMSDLKVWQRLCDLGVEKWIAGKKASGQIRQVGFSFHGIRDEFLVLLDAYDWDFCQIQYNYVNVNYQAGVTGLKRAAQKGLPVIVMEPLLGGKLATGLPKKALSRFTEVDDKISPAMWALRWLWNQSEVTVVLSGMNDELQLKDNLEAAEQSEAGMFSNKEEALFDAVVGEFNAAFKIPCTGCNYCMPCPKNVNIPACFSAYNMSYSVGKISAFQQYATSTGGFSLEKDYSPNQCIQCGKCEKHCPQHIQISNELKKVKKRMEPAIYRFAKWIMSKQRARKK